MDKENGTSVLGAGSRATVFRAWCGIFLRGVPTAISWAIILYVGAAIFSKVYAASYTWETCQTDGSGTSHTQCAYDLAEAAGFVPHTTYCTNIDPSANGAPTPPGGFIYDAGRRCQDVAANQPDCNYTNGNYCAFAGFYVTTPSCDPGFDPVDQGNGVFECVEESANACEDAYLDDTTFTQELASNPGLCEVGDFETFTDNNICTFSEGAAAYCEATHYGTVTWQATLPDAFVESGGINFTTNPCGGPGTVNGYTFPSTCGDLPPNCPVGTYYNGVTCVAYDDLDNETPPDPATAERSRTDVTTTSTVDNGDGTTTTTSTTTTTYGDCPPGETCADGFDYEGPGDREAKTFQETFEAYLADIQNAPIFQVADGIAAAVPESSVCPEFPIPEIALVGRSYTIDGHCVIADEYESEIRTVMALVWGLLGLMILLSA